jgi:hypothetical protein
VNYEEDFFNQFSDKLLGVFTQPGLLAEYTLNSELRLRSVGQWTPGVLAAMSASVMLVTAL